VIAAARRGEGLAELGADEVVASVDGLAPVDAVLENVGGPTLVAAWAALAPGGVLRSIGWTSGEAAVIPPYGTVGLAKSLISFQAGTAYGPDLAYLLDLVGAGRLTVDVGWRGSWRRFDEAVAGLLGRRFAGKAVLDHD
jgi:NADPH:quinone reductase-like Zn-dependent oxidoreductase